MKQRRGPLPLSASDASRELRWNALRLVAFGVISANLLLDSSQHNLVAYSLVASAYLAVTVTSIAASVYRPQWRNATLVYVIIDAALVAIVIYGNLLDTAVTDDHSLTTTTLVIPFILLNQVALRQDRTRILVFSVLVLTSWIGMLAIQAYRHMAVELTRSPSAFFSQDLGLAASFGLTALAVYLFVADLQETRLLAVNADRMRQNLTRFFSPQIVAALQEKGDKIELSKNRVAVMFVDMRDFTRLSENTPPEQLASLLSEYRHIVAEEVLYRSGSIDKFTGDGVLAVFGIAGSGEDEADEALGCAIALVGSLARWHTRRNELGQPALPVGIGLHYGSVVSGVVKSGMHDEFTILGDAVNTAHRLERLAKQLDAALVVSDDLVRALKHGIPSTAFLRMRDAALPGRDGRMDILFLPNDTGTRRD